MLNDSEDFEHDVQKSSAFVEDANNSTGSVSTNTESVNSFSPTNNSEDDKIDNKLETADSGLSSDTVWVLLIFYFFELYLYFLGRCAKV